MRSLDRRLFPTRQVVYSQDRRHGARAHGSAHQVAGNDAAAADELLRGLNERPNAMWIHRNLAPALLAAGRVDEAMALRDVLMAAYPDLTVARYKEAMVFAPATLERIAVGLRELGVPEK